MSTPPDCVISAAEVAHQKILDYYNKTHMTHCVVTLLDPRCKEEYFKGKGFSNKMINQYKKR
jgi:hypothetical protein